MLYLTITLLTTFFCGVWGTASPTRAPTYAPGTYDLTTGLQLNTFWMETGFIYMNNYQWKTVTTTVDTFVNPLVFISIPPVPGATHTDGYPTSARISSISTSAGQVTFTSRIYLVADGNCSTVWYTPQDIVPDLQVGYMVIEKGLYSVSSPDGAPHFMFVFETSLTRPLSTIVVSPNSFDSPVFINTAYPSGCIGVTTNCRFPVSIPVPVSPTGFGLGMVTQIQSLVNNRFLMVRGVRQRRQDIMLALSPHDPADSNSNYLVVLNPETVGIIAFEVPVTVNCFEGVAFESFYTQITSNAISFTLTNTYISFIPGVWGMLTTYTSFTDSTGVRVYDKTFTQFKIITQEDRCGDEESEHITPESITCLVVGKVAATSSTPCFILPKDPLDTFSPTAVPSTNPTPAPSSAPTFAPTSSPTSAPTDAPTSSPTSEPTSSPSSAPSNAPSSVPTHDPTNVPIVSPSASPTSSPTSEPTSAPTFEPSSDPTSSPTFSPSSSPTSNPTFSPTSSPTYTPTEAPTTSCLAAEFPVKMTRLPKPSERRLVMKLKDV